MEDAHGQQPHSLRARSQDGEALWGFGSLWTVKASAEQTGGSFALVAGHETNPEIAKRLHLSQKTVRNHVSNIFTKLQVADRAQAIIRAREADSVATSLPTDP